MQLARCQAFASACAFVQFGSLTTARLAEYDGTKSTPFFFYFHHIICTTSALLPSCYHPRCRHQPHRHPYQYRTCRVLLDVIHAAGILFSSTSYSPRLDVIHAAGILFSSTSYLSHLDVIHAAGILFSSTSYSSRLDVIHAASILFSSISYSSHHVLLYNFPLSL